MQRVTPAPKPPSRGGRERGHREGLSGVWAAPKEKGGPVCGVLFFRGFQREVAGSESISQRRLVGQCLWRRAPGGGRSPGRSAVDWSTSRRRGQQPRGHHGGCVRGRGTPPAGREEQGWTSGSPASPRLPVTHRCLHQTRSDWMDLETVMLNEVIETKTNIGYCLHMEFKKK